MTTLAAFRAAFAITATRSYLFSGGLAPAAGPVQAAIEDWITTWREDPGSHRADYHRDSEVVRRSLARLLGAPPEAISLTDTTSRANNLAVRSIPVRPGSNVMVDATTHPSTLLPWRLPELRGVELRRVPGSPSSARVAEAIDRRTAAVIVSHVDGITGHRHDTLLLGDAVHRVGGLLLVDGAQSVGAMPVRLEADGIDLLTGLSMKWLLGPPGIGFLAVSSRVVQDATPPPMIGYLASRLDELGDLVHRPDGHRHELGIGNLVGHAGFRAALDLIHATGIEPIGTLVHALAQSVIEGVAARGIEVLTPGDAHAGVVAVRLATATALAAELRMEGIDVWGYDEPGGRLRIDPHAFNTHDDVERFLGGLDAHLARTRA